MPTRSKENKHTVPPKTPLTRSYREIEKRMQRSLQSMKQWDWHVTR